MYGMICQSDVPKFMEKSEILTMITAALCHDLDHPGYNNTYQVRFSIIENALYKTLCKLCVCRTEFSPCFIVYLSVSQFSMVKAASLDLDSNEFRRVYDVLNFFHLNVIDIFLKVNARTELAIRYNDISPLENHHASVAFDILSRVCFYPS